MCYMIFPSPMWIKKTHSQAHECAIYIFSFTYVNKKNHLHAHKCAISFVYKIENLNNLWNKIKSSNKKLGILKFLGCFAYWNWNCLLWNWNPKLVQFEIRFQKFQVFGAVLHIETIIKVYLEPRNQPALVSTYLKGMSMPISCLGKNMLETCA